MKTTLLLACLAVSSAFAVTSPKFDGTKFLGNPLLDHHFTADPTAVVYKGRLYVYGTNDHQQYENPNAENKNTYEKIKTLTIMSTADMVNWTYHGEIPVSTIAPWIINSWAPSIVSRKEGDGKTFDALSDVTCTIPRGSFTAIIGTNGSGKSTLARHLNALYLPTAGEVIVEGMKTSDMEHIWDIRQKVGMVFQNPDNQLVAAIVEEDVAFGPENLGVPAEEIRKRVDYALEKVGMSAYRTHSPAMLSGGQKQRIAIAGVLAMHPDCIVLDEPTAMLDPLGRKEVMDTIHELNRSEGITIVLITHFMEEAVTADHVLVVDRTKLQMQGTAREVFSQADKLTAMGLDVPVACDLAHGLRKKGYEIPEDCMTDEELGEALCPYASNI